MFPSTASPSERLVRVSYRKTRRNKVRKVLTEIYLRDDIPCGFSDCSICQTPVPSDAPDMSSVSTVVIPDFSMVKHQLDFLSESFFSTLTLFLPQSSVAGSEVRVAKKLRNPLIFPDEFHAVCVDSGLPKSLAVASYLSHHFTDALPSASASPTVLVLTETAESKANYLSSDPSLAVLTIDEFIAQFQTADPSLGVKRRETVSDDQAAEAGGLYAAHWTREEALAALAEGRVVEGRLRVGMGGYGGGEVNGVKIEGRKNLNRALDGDLVVVLPLPAGPEGVGACVALGALGEVEKDPIIVDSVVEMMERLDTTTLTTTQGVVATTVVVTGVVVCILDRVSHEVVGSLRPLDPELVSAGLSDSVDRVFVPVDTRYPFMRLSSKKNSAALEGQRILVSVDEWSRDDWKPSCHYVEVFGPAGDRDTESKVILHMYNVSYAPFSEGVMRCLPPSDYVAESSELAKRFDFREKNICSIDPVGCKDIDDALHCEVLPNGNWEVGVHIADVTHYVLPDSAIDEEASRRCTTVYLVEKRTDMLPSLLTTDLCSLVGGKERLTFSVVWEIEPATGEIVKVDFMKGVIKSKAALSYQEAQDRIDDVRDVSELTEGIRRLNVVAKKLRSKRFEGGALELASNEVKFELDSETRDPVSMRAYEYKDTNRLVEEFMLLANCAVGQKIVDAFPSVAVLRRHPPPKEKDLLIFASLLKKRNMVNEFGYASNKELGESLREISSKVRNPEVAKLVKMMITRCMNQAVYFASGTVDVGSYYHYGLAMNVYTHFTSPIRRYADVLVHRLLAAAIGIAPLPRGYEGKTKMQQQCDVINFKHRNAQFCGRKSAELHAYLYFRNLLNNSAGSSSNVGGDMMVGSEKNTVEVIGVVVGIKKREEEVRLSVSVGKFGVEGVCVLGGEWRGEEEKAENAETGEVVEVFDKVKVKISTSDEDFRFRLVFEFVGKTQEEEDAKEVEKTRKNVEKLMFPDKLQRFDETN